jgi:uncharacterized protein
MKFLNRTSEMSRLDGLLSIKGGGLGVVYGRRRIGKTRLLLEWCGKHDGIYWVADDSGSAILRRFFALTLAERFPGFADVEYPDWSSLLSRIVKEAATQQWRGPLIIDELPYAVSSAPELPSILQRWVDHEVPKAGLVVILAGSSQRMMHGLALNASAPLFGRAKVLLQLGPLPPEWLVRAFHNLSAVDAVGYYAAWGGVPRYWESAVEHGGALEEQLHDLVLDPHGLLHHEPDRLLLEDVPTAASLRPLLDAIGLGAHRISEIGARIGMPVTSLSPHLTRLIESGLIQREVPFGEKGKSSKRSLYVIGDPFCRLWFSMVAPYRSVLAQASRSHRIALLRKHFPGLLSSAWEQLCRDVIPFIASDEKRGTPKVRWGAAGRYWHGNGPEWDVVCASIDGTRLLAGECKWTRQSCAMADITQWEKELHGKGIPPISIGSGKNIEYALFVPQRPSKQRYTEQGTRIIDAAEVFRYFTDREV